MNTYALHTPRPSGDSGDLGGTGDSPPLYQKIGEYSQTKLFYYDFLFTIFASPSPRVGTSAVLHIT